MGKTEEVPTLQDLTTMNGLFKMYRGVVEDNNSPKKDGRVRVRIFGLHTDDKTLIPTNTLPWAEVMQSLAFGYGSGTGVTSVPRTGTWVFVVLEQDNPNNPIVIGAINGTPESTTEYQLPISGREKYNDVNDLAVPNYPENHVIETLAGHIIEIDDTAGAERIRICHTNGNEVLLNNAGITVTSVKDRTELTAGKFTQTVLATTTFNSTGAIQINTAGSVNISSQGDANVKSNGNVNVTAANNINLKSLVDTNLTVLGNATLTVTGNVTEVIGGNVSSTVTGTLDATVTGTAKIHSTGAGEFVSASTMLIQGSLVTIQGASTLVI